MTDPTITGPPGDGFAVGGELTDQTHDTILDLFMAEMSRTDIVGPAGPPDGFKAACRATARVERAALAAGWSPRSAEALSILAGRVYADLLASTR